MYAIVIVPLLQSISDSLKGITLIENSLRIWLYADDNSYLRKTGFRLLYAYTVFKYLDIFGNLSGIKVNNNRTQVTDFKSNIAIFAI